MWSLIDHLLEYEQRGTTRTGPHAVGRLACGATGGPGNTAGTTIRKWRYLRLRGVPAPVRTGGAGHLLTVESVGGLQPKELGPAGREGMGHGRGDQRPNPPGRATWGPVLGRRSGNALVDQSIVGEPMSSHSFARPRALRCVVRPAAAGDEGRTAVHSRDPSGRSGCDRALGSADAGYQSGKRTEVTMRIPWRRRVSRTDAPTLGFVDTLRRRRVNRARTSARRTSSGRNRQGRGPPRPSPARGSPATWDPRAGAA
jgi:hypothetical protein